MSLVEAVMAIVVLGVAIPPLVMLFRGVSRDSVDTRRQEVAVMYADALLEEIVSKRFEDPDASAGSFGTEEGSRAAYDDVDDFDGLSNSPPKRIDGTPLSDYGGYTRSVTVENVPEDDPDGGAVADGTTDLKRIVVIVAWTGEQASELTVATLMSNVGGGGDAGGGGTGGGGGGGPLDETATEATAATDNNDWFKIQLISIASESIEMSGFSLEANKTVPAVEEFEYHGKKLWAGKRSVPTGVLNLNEGSTGQRKVAPGGPKWARVKFDTDLPETVIEFTLTIYFVDGTSSTMTFSLDYDD